MYCDYEFTLHDEITIPPNEGEGTFLESDCTEFCRSKAESLSGEQNLCCDLLCGHPHQISEPDNTNVLQRLKSTSLSISSLANGARIS